MPSTRPFQLLVARSERPSGITMSNVLRPGFFSNGATAKSEKSAGWEVV